MSGEDIIKTISVDVDVHTPESSNPGLTMQHKIASSQEEVFAAGM